MNFDNEKNLDYQLNKIASIVIKEKRLTKNYSLEDVVNKLNNIITRQSLYRYENNEARMKNNIFKKICLALGENPADVWNDINNRFLQDLKHETDEDINNYKKISTENINIYIDKEKDLTAKDVLDVNKKLMEELENKD